MVPTRGSISCRAILDRQIIHVRDMATAPGVSAAVRNLGAKSQISWPLLRDGAAIGAVALSRPHVRLSTGRPVSHMQVTRVAPGWPVPSLMHRRRVMADRITYVGLDVHKESIVVAVAVGGLRGEVREYGRIANTAGALDRLMRKLGGEGVGVRFCYEAGPCGYGIQRHLSAHGHECVVVAPSLIPKRAGDRVKTDRRDAASLARLQRAGELTAVWVPDAQHEAMRDLVRARLDAVHALRRHASSSRAFCCARAVITGARRGPSCIADGSRVCASSTRCITSCWKIIFRRLKPPRPGAIG